MKGNSINKAFYFLISFISVVGSNYYFSVEQSNSPQNNKKQQMEVRAFNEQVENNLLIEKPFLEIEDETEDKDQDDEQEIFLNLEQQKDKEAREIKQLQKDISQVKQEKTQIVNGIRKQLDLVSKKETKQNCSREIYNLEKRRKIIETKINEQIKSLEKEIQTKHTL